MATWYQVTITAETSENDVTRLDFDNVSGANIYISQNAYTDDGYSIVCYDDGGDKQALRPGATATVRAFKDGSTSSTDHATYALADTEIQALAASDGYELIDVLDGSPSRFIQRRPALWNEYWDGDEEDYGAGQAVDRRTNDWAGRSETDRP